MTQLADKNPHELQSANREGQTTSSRQTMWLVIVPKKADKSNGMSASSQNRRTLNNPQIVTGISGQFQINTWNGEGFCPLQ